VREPEPVKTGEGPGRKNAAARVPEPEPEMGRKMAAARVPAKLAATLSTARSGAGAEARTRSGESATSVARDAGAGDGEEVGGG